ncbi:MAG: hypothetical protein HY010_10260 [Acidobacteria bacterium]|nr:hypothetical protein [Acidobacteriota bacterium]
MVRDQWPVASGRRVRKVMGILGLILVVQASYSQEKKPWNVDQICGRVEYLKRIPEKKHTDNYSEKRKSLKDVPLELYESSENQACCEGLKSVGSYVSGRNGQFEFRPEKPGHYWLTAKWNGKEYNVGVVYEPQKKSSTLCSQQGLQIEDDGSASWWITVTVD